MTIWPAVVLKTATSLVPAGWAFWLAPAAGDSFLGSSGPAIAAPSIRPRAQNDIIIFISPKTCHAPRLKSRWNFRGHKGNKAGSGAAGAVGFGRSQPKTLFA